MDVPERIYVKINHPISSEYTEIIAFEEGDGIEYCRTDAFIEKATLWLLTNASDYCTLHNSYDTKELVKDFVDAMKRD